MYFSILCIFHSPRGVSSACGTDSFFCFGFFFLLTERKQWIPRRRIAHQNGPWMSFVLLILYVCCLHLPSTSIELHQSECVFRIYVDGGLLNNPLGLLFACGTDFFFSFFLLFECKQWGPYPPNEHSSQ
jgi:hypothetical protein